MNCWMNLSFKNTLIQIAEIPLTSLEDWFVLYSIMPGREDKIVLLEEYFDLYGITNPDLLLNALKRKIPERIKNRIDQLL